MSSTTTAIPKAVFAVDAIMLIGLFFLWTDPNGFCDQVFNPQELAAVPPRVIAALKNLFFIQVWSFGLGACTTSLYLILKGVDPFVGYLIWVVLNVGLILSEFVFPFPTIDGGVKFMGFEGVTMDIAVLIRLGMALMNGAAMYYVKQESETSGKQMKWN